MRTKTILLTAALSAAGVATSMAQVYSVNAVGYVNVTLSSGFSLIANPLNGSPDNKLSSIWPVASDGTKVYLFNNPGGFQNAITFFVDPDDPNNKFWDQPDQLIPPGRGMFVSSPAPQSQTFVGEVPQGPALNVNVPVGANLISSIVPQQALITTVMGFPGSDGDKFYAFTGGAYENAKTFFVDPDDPNNKFWDNEPNPPVASGFFLIRATAGMNWTRSFSVNP